MRLVCLHADTVDALKRLNIEVDDLTPSGLWSSPYHLIGLTLDQFQALEVFNIEAEDITPAPLAQAATERPQASGGETVASAARPPSASRTESAAPSADRGAREPVRGGANEAEVPLAQTRDASARSAEPRIETKPESKPEGRTAPAQPTAQTVPQSAAPQPSTAQQAPSQKGGKGGPQQAQPHQGQPQQGNRKGQPVQAPPSSGHRHGTTRLRISVAGKYTEATVANGKIIIGNRTFDSPDQAAAELTKSRGDWTFWEYYDSTDGKWRMLTRDWDTVLKSAAPGGR